MVRMDIRDGDLAIYRNGGIIGRLDDCTHVGRFAWFHNTLSIFSFREWKGCEIAIASQEVTLYPGRIDVYCPNYPMANMGQIAAELTYRQLNKPYGWWMIWRAAFMRLSLIRLLTGWRYDEADMEPLDWKAPKDCSAAAVWIDRRVLGHANFVRWPCPGRADWACYPTHLAHDSFYAKKFEGLIHKRAA